MSIPCSMDNCCKEKQILEFKCGEARYLRARLKPKNFREKVIVSEAIFNLYKDGNLVYSKEAEYNNENVKFLFSADEKGIFDGELKITVCNEKYTKECRIIVR